MNGAVKTSAGAEVRGQGQRVIRTAGPVAIVIGSALILSAGFCAGFLARDWDRI